MKRRIFLCCVIMSCFVCVWGVLYRCTKTLAKAGKELDAEVAALTTFNDISSFAFDPANPRRFIYKPVADEAYLRFAISGVVPSSYLLWLKIKARPELLKEARVRSARDMQHGGDVKGDVATFDISMEDSVPFMWTDGKCYVGLTFPKVSLRDGDTVELVDFKFEFVK